MTTRRAFFRTLGAAVAGFSILPSATTYVRKWIPTASGVVVPYNPFDGCEREAVKIIYRVWWASDDRIYVTGSQWPARLSWKSLGRIAYTNAGGVWRRA